MNDEKILTYLGKPLNEIDKSFDDFIFSEAQSVRRTLAANLAQDFEYAPKTTQEQEINSSFLSMIVERKPFSNAMKILTFNREIMHKACELILASNNYTLLEKISLYSTFIELNARDFIDPDNPIKNYKHLSAAKERGYFFTPPSLAVRMVLCGLKHNMAPREVLDPSCGAGMFLAIFLLFNQNAKHIVGVEIDNETATLASKLLQYVKESTHSNVDVTILTSDFLRYFGQHLNRTKYDLIIMNPPYGSIKFLASDLTDKSTKALLSSDEIHNLSKRLRKETINYATFLRKQFSSYGIGKGTLEYSKLFLAAAHELLSDSGSVVAITSSTWLGDESSTEFRKNILKKGFIFELWNFIEAAKLFKGVNQPTTVAVINKKFNQKIVLSDHLQSVLEIDSKAEKIDISTVFDVAGEKLKFPKGTEFTLKILERVLTHGRIKDNSELINARGELDLTAQKEFVTSQDTGHRLIRGDHIYGCRLNEAETSQKAGYVEFSKFLDSINSSAKKRYIMYPRIAISQCSYLQKKKRVEACIVPSECIISNSCNFISLIPENQSNEKMCYYWWLANSAIIEWQFRIFSYNNHVANKEIDEWLCIPFDDLPKNIKSIFSSLSRNEDFSNYDLSLMDAAIAYAFGITKKELIHILNTIGSQQADEILNCYDQLLENAKIESSTQKVVPNHTMPSLSELDKTMIKHIPPGGNWTSIPESVPSKRLEQIREMTKKRGLVRTTYYSRLKYNQPAYTISTYFNRPGNGANIHPWEHRTLSSREAARIQSFPDSFCFYGSDAAIRNQIGNAVPPLVGYAIGSEIRNKLGCPVKFCDLFAGAGGLSYGLELSGHIGAVALEIDESAAKTFTANHSREMDMIVGDIRDSTVIEQLIFTLQSKISQKEIWVLAGGPPCQGFSTAGYRKENDVRNKLVNSYLSIIEKLKPSIVVMENVHGILSMAGGSVIKGVYEALTGLGYVLPQKPWIINAEEYGVPQMRKRVIIIAAKSQDLLPDFPDAVFLKCLGRRETESDRRSPILRYPITVGEALYGLPALSPIIDEFYPHGKVIDETFSQWCSGIINVEQLFSKRSQKEKEKMEGQTNITNFYLFS